MRPGQLCPGTRLSSRLSSRDYAAWSAFFLHDAENADIPVDIATIGVKIAEQLPSVGLVYPPMRDTALIRGVASRSHNGVLPFVTCWTKWSASPNRNSEMRWHCSTRASASLQSRGAPLLLNRQRRTGVGVVLLTARAQVRETMQGATNAGHGC